MFRKQAIPLQKSAQGHLASWSGAAPRCKSKAGFPESLHSYPHVSLLVLVLPRRWVIYASCLKYVIYELKFIWALNSSKDSFWHYIFNHILKEKYSLFSHRERKWFSLKSCNDCTRCYLKKLYFLYGIFKAS